LKPDPFFACFILSSSFSIAGLASFPHVFQSFAELVAFPRLPSTVRSVRLHDSFQAFRSFVWRRGCFIFLPAVRCSGFWSQSRTFSAIRPHVPACTSGFPRFESAFNFPFTWRSRRFFPLFLAFPSALVPPLISLPSALPTFGDEAPLIFAGSS